MQPHSGAWAFMSLAGFVGATSDAATSAWTRLPGGSPAKKHREVFTVLLYRMCDYNGVMDTPSVTPNPGRQETSGQAFDVDTCPTVTCAEVAELVTITHRRPLRSTPPQSMGIEQLIQPAMTAPASQEFLALELGPVLESHPTLPDR